MNKLFTENLPWKITSLVLAFILWLFVINTQNPIQPQEISGINVVITGLDELGARGYKLKNEEEIRNQNFKVVVSGPRLEIDKLVKNPKLITATLNISDYMNNLNGTSLSDNANYVVKINLDSYTISVTDKKPQVNKVIIDKIGQKLQKVTYEIAKDLTDTYTLIGDGVPVITPDKVTITGPKSDIDRVSEAKVYIEAKDFSEEKLVANLPIKLYDAEGVEITSLSLSKNTVEVKLPIGSEKEVPIKLNYTGEMKEGLVLINTIISPQKVKLIGKADILAGIKEVELEPIDLSKIEKTDLIVVAMKLPEGVMTLMDNKVNVSVEVMEEETLEYPIQTNDMDLEVIGLEHDLSYEILTPAIKVMLSALPNKLLGYTKDDIKFTLNLSGYREGEYRLPLTVIPPEDVRVVGGPITLDIQIKKLLVETPSPSPTPNEGGGVGEGSTTDTSETQ